MADKFVNPINGHVETVKRTAWLWALLFGPFYFASKGVWSHFVIAWLVWPWGAVGALAVVAWALVLVLGGSVRPSRGMDPQGAALLSVVTPIAVIYALRTAAILRRHYGRLGWREMREPPPPPPSPPQFTRLGA